MRMTKALIDVDNERKRQMDAECWSPMHDDIEHSEGQLAAAAAIYALSAAHCAPPVMWLLDEGLWPWDMEYWKPKSPREDLVRAGALILAEIERLDRAEPEKEQTP